MEDHPLFRTGLRAVLASEPDIEIVGEVDNGADALLFAAQTAVDVALVDVGLPAMDGMEVTALLRESHPSCVVLAVSCIEEPLQIARMLEAGAHGYYFKTQDSSELAGAIRAVRGGVRYLPNSVAIEDLDASSSLGVLSAREHEVLALLISGSSNDEIATALFVARRTVETHRQRIMKKLGAHTIAGLVHMAIRLGYASR